MVTVDELLRVIRAECLDCAGGNVKEVENCKLGDKCKLWPYRMGVTLPKARRGRPKKLSQVI